MNPTVPARRARRRVTDSALLAPLALAVLYGAGVVGCSSSDNNPTPPEKCEIAAGAAAPDFLRRVGCQADFVALSSAPLDSTIPGARSGKVVLDTSGGKDELYFQNSVKYPIHYNFASKYLGAPDHPVVGQLSDFNSVQYYSVQRRFILGAVTYYEASDLWTLEISPYDTASAAMIEKLFNKVKASAFYGSKLFFHPTSGAVETVAKMLPSTVPIKTTNDIFANTAYQPLNLATSIGKLRFVKADNLQNEYLNFRDIVVLDRVPNDISVVVGMITEEFQTPLAHINVLAQNRHIPNMGLKKATMDAKLLALDGKWVQLTVGALDWSITQSDQTQADEWWEAHKPKPVLVPDMDLTVTDIKDIDELVDESGLEPGKPGLDDRIKKAILAFGGKAANYSILAKTPGVPVRKAFAVPVYYYDQFMKQNGFYARVDAMLADPVFLNDAKVRDEQLRKLRGDIEKAPVDPAFSALLKAKLDKDFPGQTMRFRTSTNAEDQEDFLCAGCYDSHTGDPADWGVDRAECDQESNHGCSVLQAIRKTWSGVWYFRTFEERSYNSIDQKKIGMALLVHHNFPNEAANGVAVTSNIFDSSGLEPAFYINIQHGGDAEVVAPPRGVFSDEILFFYSYSGTPITYLGHSNLVAKGETVLTDDQVRQLGTVLELIHNRFSPAYGPVAGNKGFYALEVDIKFDNGDNPQPGVPPELYIKQARNYHGRSAM